ncbi:MAG: B12-binding domain-containing radical SAM protein [Armatimonadetes bacterium]|nr:B12-binding domain-containing radical SAM protein [Armatimonadota bacterium]
MAVWARRNTMICLINPNHVLQRNDPFTTGIPYMPVGLAYFAAALRARGHAVQVIDAFGERPMQARVDGLFMTRGLRSDEVVDRIGAGTRVAALYAINLTYHRALAAILAECRRRRPDVTAVVMENTQAVTAYALRHVQADLHAAGADYVLTGEAEERGVRLIEALLAGREPANVDGVGYRRDGALVYRPPAGVIADLDALPPPAWDLFPLQNYWDLGYAHGPLQTGRYLPLLTSRGCPYLCRFCVIPETNGAKWRGRSARSVVDEMEDMARRFGVRDFHLEDVDPTVSDRRTREICQEILGRRLDVIWKIVAGTKVETIRDEETVALMARAGCRYISISPESGSPRVLRMIGKPFDLDHAVRMVAKMNRAGICSQACFVLGFPGEEDDDRRLTWNLVHDLAKAGVDEIVLFIVTPVPGSAIHDRFAGYTDYSQLTFSPTWRRDYALLNRFRRNLYARFFLWKLRYHPGRVIGQGVNLLRRSFQTKAEMACYRAVKLKMLEARAAS